MLCRFAVLSVFSALALGIVSSASAGVLWDESVNGDLGDTGTATGADPITFVGTLTHGSNQIIGLTGRPGPIPTTPERDYFFVTVPDGLHLAAISVLPGANMGSLGFIGLQAGSEITLLPTTSTACTTPPSTPPCLLGWWHYSAADVGHDILPSMSIPNLDGFQNTGFSIPLGPGNYAFWVQDTSDFTAPGGPGVPFNWGFDLLVVPEPGTIAMMLLGLGGLGFSLRKRA